MWKVRGLSYLLSTFHRLAVELDPTSNSFAICKDPFMSPCKMHFCTYKVHYCMGGNFQHDPSTRHGLTYLGLGVIKFES